MGDRMQRESAGSSALDIDAIRRLYGSGLAMRLVTERRMAQNVGGRLLGSHGTGHSNVMLDALTGDDMSIEFGDYLYLEHNRPTVSMVGNDANLTIHAAMEK